MGREHVVSVADHVVDDCICIDSHSLGSASVDHSPELFGGALAGMQLITHGLVDPVPGVEFSVFGVFEVEDGFGRREDLDAEIACLSDHLALLGNVVVGPAEHLDDGSLLAVLEVGGLVDRGVVPGQA
jgi:hypothetical protein